MRESNRNWYGILFRRIFYISKMFAASNVWWCCQQWWYKTRESHRNSICDTFQRGDFALKRYHCQHRLLMMPAMMILNWGVTWALGMWYFSKRWFCVKKYRHQYRLMMLRAMMTDDTKLGSRKGIGKRHFLDWYLWYQKISPPASSNDAASNVGTKTKS